MSLKAINFENANQFLNTIASPNRRLIPEEYSTLVEYVAELDPTHPSYSTLSSHRKSELEKRINKLADAIEKKLHPIHLRLSEIIQKQSQAIQEFSKRLPLPYNELRNVIKNMHPDLAKKIYYAIWLASGCPKQDPFGTEVLKSDSCILQRKFPAFFGSLKGTLLEQIASELEMEHQRAVIQETIDDLHETNKNLADQKKIDLARLTQQRDDQKVKAFESHFIDMKINSRQIQALFDVMPETIKSRLPKPPYFGRGFNSELYKTLGAHYDKKTGLTTFRVYAPHARNITLNLTAWRNIEHSILMTKKENGIWEAQTEQAKPGRSYHFMIVGQKGDDPFKKVDPFAFGNIFHCRGTDQEDFESIVLDIDQEFGWSDQTWMMNRVNINPAMTPMSIYEVHSPTWKKKDNGDPLNWRELASKLSTYCKEMGYSHVELMALFEHPRPISMGYQITNFYTLNSSMGSIEDFQFFVNHLHEQGIGVIADWVPAHFAMNKSALSLFDGSALLEDDQPEYALHPIWETYEFDYKKQFTKDFIGSNLDFLLKKFHFDGIRVDAVQSILNYNRDRLDANAGDINIDSKEFFSNLNAYVHKKYPGTLMIAEEAMGFPNLVRPVTELGQTIKTSGVGFDLTWHMGFMNDTLKYMGLSPHQRLSKFSTFIDTIKKVDCSDDFRPRGKVVLPFSHDENANGHGTIFTKMAGDSWPDKFANGRLLLAYQLLRGGGPILDFMGNEILQTEEWHWRLIKGLNDASERKKASVQWEELSPHLNPQYSRYHIGVRESRKALLRLYRDNPGLQNQTDAGISWIDAKDSENCVLSFHRRGGSQQFACIFNASDKDLNNYLIPLPETVYAPELEKLVGIKEVYNTDAIPFGGEGRVNAHIEILLDPTTNHPTHLKLHLPPYSALVLEEQFS